MRARRRTSAVPQTEFFVRTSIQPFHGGDVPWWWCDLFWCHEVGCGVRWSNVIACEVTWGVLMWLVATCHVMSCDVVVMSFDVMWFFCVVSCHREAMRCHVMCSHVMSCHLLCSAIGWNMLWVCDAIGCEVTLCGSKWLCDDAVIQSTTKYYSVLKSTTEYYNEYHSEVQSTTLYYKVLLRTTKYYSVLRSTTPYYKVLLCNICSTKY